MQRLLLLAITTSAIGCMDALDVNFDIPRGEVFPAKLSAYGLYQGEMRDLAPAEGSHVFELNAPLFTDHAGKQRLLRVPAGALVSMEEGMPRYPEGSVLAKTFYWDADQRDPAQGRRIVETRLLVMTEGQWNVATYVWNDDQSDADLTLEGATVPVTWLDKNGQRQSIEHAVPSEVACVTCHQVDGTLAPIGPKVRNLAREVEIEGETVSQIDHMRAMDLLPAEASDIAAMVDYRDADQSLEDRAYLDINCAHCHHPTAWMRSAMQKLDLRYETPLAETGILDKIRPMRRQLMSGGMPWIGTTLPDDEGISLVFAYLSSL